MQQPKSELEYVEVSQAEEVKARVAELATWSELDYELVRIEEANKLGLRQSVLDKAVGKIRKETQQDESDAKFTLTEVEPWPEPVDGAATLVEISKQITRYAIVPKGAADTIALWIVHAHALDAFYVSPSLCINSPQYECGKSRVKNVLCKLLHKPINIGHTSAAPIFRCIKKRRPVLLMDEAERYINDDEGLGGILNSGHTKDESGVFRCVGDNNEEELFSTWVAKAFFLIGKMHVTMMSRSIIIPMKRKLPTENIERFRGNKVQHLGELARKIRRWSLDNFQNFVDNDSPPLPAELANRGADNWETLLIIADIAGGEWPERARQAIIDLMPEAGATESRNVLLLRDIKEIFEGLERIHSQVLLDKLHALEDRPWNEYSYGRPISANQLANVLKKYGIKPLTMRVSGSNKKGYSRASFEDAWARYVDQAVTPSQPVASKAFSPNQAVTSTALVTDQKPPQPAPDKDCYDVTGQIGVGGATDRSDELLGGTL